ncbi:TonB family protein [Halanaerobium hydrogeniformans]|uniref:TonB family protein n=1 Tax=Halanaerobium hydrogeniformans TaxID=656519 RepID=E4RKI6_HALHG|nr:TonB family protein [Halanaerobium hydrogeniformans]ADQ14695.1 TonB family protein [Halanaerobium hydrogeniformans]
MPNKNDQNKLLKYIILSLIFHLIIIYIIPIGFMHGSAQSNGQLSDYRYIQMVDYQPSLPDVDQVEPEAEAEAEEEEVVEEEIDEVDDPVEEEIDEVDDPVEEEIEEQVIEEDIEIEEEEIIVDEPSEEIAEEAVEDIIEEDIAEEVQEIIAAEESELEIEIDQDQDTASDTEQIEQEESETQQESEVEQESETVEETAVEEEPPPPPPPTSGDLVNLIVAPAFPKDLVGSRSEGVVKLSAEVSRQGEIREVDIVESSGYESMDRVAAITIERGWTFKEYQQPYRIPVTVEYYIDDSDNTQVEVELGEIQFISGGE